MNSKILLTTICLCLFLCISSPGFAQQEDPDQENLDMLEQRVRDPITFYNLFMDNSGDPQTGSIQPSDYSTDTDTNQFSNDEARSIDSNAYIFWTRMTFASFRDNNFEIYTADGDGKNHTRITNRSRLDIMPEFNRGCTKIVYVSEQKKGYEISTMNANGSNQVMLTQNSKDDSTPTWSPNGSKIAFYSYRDGNAEIYVMNADGSNQTRLTNHPAWDGHPTWSPDGSKIAFSSNRTGYYEIWSMNANGTNLKQISTNIHTALYPDWSPTGNMFVFNYDADSNGWLDLGTIKADGSGFKCLDYYPLWNEDRYAPSWSPDGSRIVYNVIYWAKYSGVYYWNRSHLYQMSISTEYDENFRETDDDWFADWKTTDIIPPVSNLTTPSWSGSPSFEVNWISFDKGQSGGPIYYDVQVRDGINGVWKNWLLKTHDYDALYTGEYGHTYYFRCRATDTAYNVESFPTGNNADMTRVYRHKIHGLFLGNREQPVSVVEINITPASMNKGLSNIFGEATLFLENEGFHDLNFVRNVFGPIAPIHNLSVTHDIDLPPIYLPPADDVVVNGRFDSGSLDSWTARGDATPMITSTAYWGEYGVELSFADEPIRKTIGNLSAHLVQTITLPLDLISPTLSLMYQITNGDPLSNTLQVSLQGVTQIMTMTLPVTATGWQHTWWDLSAWSNPTLTLSLDFSQKENAPANARVFFDEISIGSALKGSYSIFMPVVLQKP